MSPPENWDLIPPPLSMVSFPLIRKAIMFLFYTHIKDFASINIKSLL